MEDLDFSYSIEKWMNIFREFFVALQNFLNALGITLFAPSSPDEPASEEPTSSVQPA